MTQEDKEQECKKCGRVFGSVRCFDVDCQNNTPKITMNQEHKELLLQDLSTRLPYGVIGQCEIDASYDTSFDTIFQTHKFNAAVYGLKADLLFVTPLIEDKDEQEFANEEVADGIDILDFKPYLFPLSSMTKEQEDEWDDIYIKPLCERLNPHTRKEDLMLRAKASYAATFWLIENHFDYLGLIPLGLALDATNLNIY